MPPIYTFPSWTQPKNDYRTDRFAEIEVGEWNVILFAEIDSWTVFWGTLPATIAAVAALVQSIRNNKKVTVVEEKVDKVGHEVNSRLSQLVESTEKASHAVGKEEGVKEERDRAKGTTGI
jgi:hypothetical protein